MEISIDYPFLESLPTLNQGHFANLKIDTGEIRVWVSRMSIQDGETEPVSIERLLDGNWTPHHGDIHLSDRKHSFTVRYLNRDHKVRREYDHKTYFWDSGLNL